MHDTIQPWSADAGLARLLRRCGLDPADLDDRPAVELAGVRGADGPVAAVGLEHHGRAGLLRSLAVAPEARGRGLARRLVAHAEDRARRAGLADLFLLTDTADELFGRLGYTAVARAAAPAAIRSSPQFASLCPASATCMHKHLGSARGGPRRSMEASR